ncbi:hypothetical protein [Spiroplasma endosymbiont of Stenodema calcarata]|uniref:hypothetical protein n=1 Tax=Spiroplasma endosymbiont of Stenodema calcarata TaxID=3139328 RepID=UPI003CCA9ABE
MKYLVMLTKVNKNRIIKNIKTGKEDNYDVLKFQPIEKNENGEYESSNLLPMDKWFKQDDENYNQIKSMCSFGTWFYVGINWYGKIGIVEPYIQNNSEQDFINKYSNNSAISESNN